MRAGWVTKPLNKVVAAMESVNPTHFPDDEFDYIDVSSVSNETFTIETTQRLKGKDAPSRARRRVRANDVLFATIRPTLQRIAVVPEKLDGEVCSTGYAVLRPSGEVAHRFLFYWLFSDSFSASMESLQKGASYPAVTNAEVFGQRISYPPLSEQHRIVAILDEAFAAIATAKANTEKNLQNAREMFESQREMLFDLCGEEWKRLPLSDLCDIKHGYAFKGKFFRDAGDYVLLTPGNFYEKGGYRDRGEKQKFYVGEIPDDYVLEKGDLLVAMTEQAAGLLGSPMLVPESDVFLHNQRLGLVEAKPNVTWLNKFFFHVFNTRAVRGAIHRSASGVKVRHTSPTKIGQVVVAFPDSVAAQQKIVEDLTLLAAESGRLESIYRRSISALDELKQSLLHQAFTGALTAKAADRQLAEAV